MPLNGCVYELGWIGEVAVERPQREARAFGDLVHCRKERVFGEHIDHDRKHLGDVALAALDLTRRAYGCGITLIPSVTWP